MSNTTDATPEFAYDFSRLSKGRLRAYNRMVEEFDRLQREESSEVAELDDSLLEMLSAAGDLTAQNLPDEGRFF